jgi:hypothetical protein
VPTPVTLEPDDPSLFGWPAGVGGAPLTYWAQAAGHAEAVAVARINAGGPEVTTGDGSVWAADDHYEGGQAVARRLGTEVGGAAADALYRDERRCRIDGGRVRYAVPVLAPGRYTVRVYVAAGASDDGAGGLLTGAQVLAVNSKAAPGSRRGGTSTPPASRWRRRSRASRSR